MRMNRQWEILPKNSRNASNQLADGDGTIEAECENYCRLNAAMVEASIWEQLECQEQKQNQTTILLL
ncbi:hypothetical protein GCK32_014189 [Trichostrongylus colubriformis]|uniref:Uncharacterized protein n=1 Tax=Trichostrongylus colubriformis TaxID=6319 RepID=A0AAN8ER26_TRICO